MSLPRGQNPFPLKPRNPDGRTVIVSCIFLSLMIGLSVVAGYRMAQQDARAKVTTTNGLDIELVKRSDGRIYLLQDPTYQENPDKDFPWNWQTEINPDGTFDKRIRVGG